MSNKRWIVTRQELRQVDLVDTEHKEQKKARKRKGKAKDIAGSKTGKR
jgi:hypothetical protein